MQEVVEIILSMRENLAVETEEQPIYRYGGLSSLNPFSHQSLLPSGQSDPPQHILLPKVKDKMVPPLNNLAWQMNLISL